MRQYIDIIEKVLKDGVFKEDRTGTGCYSYPGMFFEHDMSNGFPLLTTKRIPFNLITSELEFFIKGITDKRWLQERNNHIWDEWCSPLKVPYGHDEETLKRMNEEMDLGCIYGWQWRHFGGEYLGPGMPAQGIDQLEILVRTLKTDPNSRRMLVIAWNPLDNDKMALFPCHWAFQVTVTAGKLNLFYNIRSNDLFLGCPFNIASYATLLHLLALETGYKEGRLCGFIGDAHIYSNHVDQVKTQITRSPRKLPTIKTNNFTSIFDWKYTDTEVVGYDPYPGIKAPIAV